jgi:hypothetical protein
MTGAADGSKLCGSLGLHQFCLPQHVARLIDRPAVSGTANDDKEKVDNQRAAELLWRLLAGDLETSRDV